MKFIITNMETLSADTAITDRRLTYIVRKREEERNLWKPDKQTIPQTSQPEN